VIHRSLVQTLFGSIALAVLLGLPSSATAQYFGRNKVQYEDFDWQVLETDHFDVYWYDGMAEGAPQDAGRMMERWYRRLSEVFGHEFEDRKPLILYANKPDFQQTNTTPQLISEATGGFTEGLKNRIVLPFTETYMETDHVLGHELVHGFQFDMAFRARSGGNAVGTFRLPLWVIEGLAEYLTLGSTHPLTAMWMRDAVLRDDFPTLQQLSRDPRYFPYRFGHAFWAYVAGVYGDRRVTGLYQSMSVLGVSGGIQEVLLSTPDSLSGNWRQEVFDEYGPYLVDRTPPEEVGERLVRDGSGWALAPVLSPDGDLAAFLSQRDLFTIDLFLADARTGEVLGKLASEDRNPHFDALSFISSSGSWSPDGERFAFITVARGDNGVAIADVGARKVVENHRLEGVEAIHSVAWSPEGNRLVVSGNTGGVTDLYMYHLSSGEVEQLTDDTWAELHPAWSPDGSTIAFVTDRNGDRELRDLALPGMGLGFLDVATGEIEVRRPFGKDAKHINPQYGADGESLWFIGAPDGVSDIFRIDLASSKVHRVTKIATGISGITDLAPALSVGGDGSLAFSVFSGGQYLGRTLGPEEALGEPVPDEEPEMLALLPPAERPDVDRVDRYVADARTGLVNERGFREKQYDPALSLDFLAPPSAGVGVDRFGAGLGGSLGMFFSDMLGNRQMGIGIWANGGVEDLGGQVVYQNLDSRWNWGGSVGRIPFRSGFSRVRTDPETGAQVVEVVVERVALSSASLLAEYPISATRRIEGDVGFSRFDFDREAIRSAFVGGIELGRDRVDLESPDAINLGQASLAYVEDFSFFGFTSPVRGGRARFEVEGNAGTINWVNVLADWRRYWFSNPVTIAVRALHFGRYGGGADSDRLSSLFVGFPSLIRGYDSDSFEPDECTTDPDAEDEFNNCPEFDRLLGTRIGVANFEVRLPLVGTDEFGLLSGGFLPTELAFFTDMGMAWNNDEGVDFKLETRSTDRIPVFSSGVSLRINLLGALIGELYYVEPWQRPDKGGFFAFQIQPGW